MNWSQRPPNTLFMRMALAFTALFTVTTVVITWAITAETARSQLQVYERIGESLVQLTRPAVQRMLVEYNTAGLKIYMSALSGDPVIAAIEVTDDRGISMYHFRRDFESASC